MPAKIEYEPNNICVLRISGTLKRSEFGAEQSAMAGKIDAGAKPRLLAIVENFEAGNVAQIGMIWISFFRIAIKLQRSQSSRSPAGRYRHLPSPERECVARR